MELIYTERPADSISAIEWGELSILTKSAFAEHKAKGLNMLPSYADDAQLARFLAGCLYLQTDTSCKAKSSRSYHRSCGFEDWYYTHWRTTNYYSIVMRKDLPPGKRMSRFRRYKSLVQSYLSVHFRYSTEGKERTLYCWLKSLLRKTS